MFGTKLYIFGGGRWREVSVESGFVEGWGRGSFAYADGGKFKMAKTPTVTSDLRKYVKGKKNGTVRDGIHLPFMKLEVTPRIEEKQTDMRSCNYGRRCQQINNNGCQPKKTIPCKELSVNGDRNQIVNKAEVGVQTSQASQVLLYPDSKKLSLKRRRNTVSSIENESPTNITTDAIVQTKPKVSKILLKKQWSLACEELTSKEKVPSLKLQKADSTKYDLYRRKRTESSDSLIWVVMPKSQSADVKSSKSERVTKLKRNERRKSMYASSSEELQPKPKKRRKSAPDAVVKDKDVEDKVAKISTTSDDEDEIAIKSKPKSHRKNLNDTQSTDTLRELNISESDVEVLRNYLMNTKPDFDLLKFDMDDNYKVQFFYSINPLVNVARCRIIAKMLRRDSRDEISLKVFATQLGLKSISETSAPRRYKMRNTKEINKLNRTSYISDSEINKLNVKKQKVHDSRSNFSDSDFETITDSEDEDVRRKMKSSSKDYKIKTLRSKNSSINTSKKNICDESSDEDSSSLVESKKVILRKRKARANTIDLSLIDSGSDKKSSQDNKNYRKNGDGKIKTIDLTSNDLKKLNETSNKTIQSKPKKNNEDKVNNSKTEQMDSKNSKQNISSMLKERDAKGRYIKERDAKGRYIKERNLTNKNKDDKEKPLKKLPAKEPVRKNYSENEYYSSDPEETFEEDKFTTKQTNTRQNKTIGSDTDISRLTRSAKDKSKSETRKNNNSENTQTEKDSNLKVPSNLKRKLNIDTTSNKIKEKVQNRVSNYDDTTETIHLSSDDENTNITKKFTEKIKAVTANEDRPRSSSSVMRAVPYTNLEDHAIVSWISCGGRARCVNGNRVWQELQDQYYSISGQHRSWHSLRNRYLRHILPGLGFLSLNPSQVSRLRAAAATGEIKSRNKIPPRRNSIFGAAAATGGALSRRPRRLSSESDNEYPLPAKRHKHDGRKKSPLPTTRLLRSSLTMSSEKKPAHSPRYSDITRKFADKHRYESTPNTSPLKDKQTEGDNKNKSEETDKFRDKNKSLDREISTTNPRRETRNRSSQESGSMKKHNKVSPDREIFTKNYNKDNSKRNYKKSLTEREINKTTDRNVSDVEISTDSEIEIDMKNRQEMRKSTRLSLGSRKKVLCKITRRNSLSDKSNSNDDFTKSSPIKMRRKSLRESVRDVEDKKDRGKNRKLFNPKLL